MERVIYLVKSDKNTIVDLSKSEQLKGLADFGANLVNTADKHKLSMSKQTIFQHYSPSDTDDKSQFGLGWYIKTTRLLGLTS